MRSPSPMVVHALSHSALLLQPHPSSSSSSLSSSSLSTATAAVGAATAVDAALTCAAALAWASSEKPFFLNASAFSVNRLGNRASVPNAS